MEASGQSVWSVSCCLCGIVTWSAQWFGYLYIREGRSMYLFLSTLKMELCPLLFSQENIFWWQEQERRMDDLRWNKSDGFSQHCRGITSFCIWNMMAAQNLTNVSLHVQILYPKCFQNMSDWTQSDFSIFFLQWSYMAQQSDGVNRLTCSQPKQEFTKHVPLSPCLACQKSLTTK